LLPTANGRSYEIDFIIIGNNWIFLLDEKSWRSPIQGDEEYWIRADGSSEKSPLAKIDFVAKVVASSTSYKLTALKEKGHFVRSGIVFSSLERLPQIHDTRARNGLFLLSDVCERLQELDSRGGNARVGQLRQKVKTTFTGMDNRPKVPKQINLYLIEECVILRPHVRLFRAAFKGHEGTKQQLLVYDCGRDPLKVSMLQDFYMQECRALQELSHTGLVPHVSLPFTWSDDFLVVPIAPPPGVSLSAYPLPETQAEFVQDLLMVKACFEGLDHIHSRDVLHRALGPDAIFIQKSQPPKIVFTNFYAARIGSQTIATTLDELSIEDPYLSLDLAIGYEYATVQTDTFSLALILLERLSGVSITDIRASVESPIIMPHQPCWSSVLPPKLADELMRTFQQLLLPEKDASIPSAEDVATQLDTLINHLQSHIQLTEESVVVPLISSSRRLLSSSSWLETQEECVQDQLIVPEGSSAEKNTLMGGRFIIQRLLGEGAMARTYLVKLVGYEQLGYHVLKQFLRPNDGTKQAIDEYNALKKIRSKYFPSIEDIYPLEYDAHIKMEYIPGSTLQQIESELPWSLERWWSFAKDLLSAVRELEEHQILHRDIKPANIILHETENYPVLIDFGFAIQKGAVARVAGTPLYLPPEAAMASEPPPSSDRYAVGVVLFQTLTGRLPFKNLTNGRELIDPEEIDDKIRHVAIVILQAVSSDPELHPKSATAMSNQLKNAMLASQGSSGRGILQLPLSFFHPVPFVDLSSTYRSQATVHIFKGHTEEVYSVTWAPNGRYLATASADRTIRVWDILTGDSGPVYQHLQGRRAQGVQVVTWSPDGARLASMSNNQVVRVRDAFTGDILITYEDHVTDGRGFAFALAWSPNSRYMASGSDSNVVFIWDAALGNKVQDYHGHKSWIAALAWSPDGTRVASGSRDKTMQVWEAFSGKHILTYGGHMGEVTTIAWSPDSKLLASAYRDKVIVWDTTNKDVIYAQYNHHRGVNAVAWSPDGAYLASAGNDHEVEVWNIRKQQRIFAYEEHHDQVRSITWSPDGRYLASAGADKQVCLWKTP